MKNKSIVETDFEKIERFQALQAGQYWRAIKDIPRHGISKDMVLLIQSIRDVDNSAHTIILRAHPEKIGKSETIEIKDDNGDIEKHHVRYGQHTFLVKEFLSSFEFEPDHQIIRQQERLKIQQKITWLQQELMDFQSDPSVMAAIVDQGLKNAAPEIKEQSESSQLPISVSQHQMALRASTGTLVDLINSGITPAHIETLKVAVHKEHQVATIKAQWIQNQTESIGKALKAMTPFFEEQAAAALAQTEDVKTYVNNLLRGIQSLDLYVGKDVTVETIRKGESAPACEPLTLMQKKLLMDEELAVFTDVDEWFDFSKDKLFFDAINAHDELVNQIFPTMRCVLVMATTRRQIDYGDSWTNENRNQENRAVFLLVRDGWNIYRVFSPVESHLSSAKLFPSKSDQDNVFKGFDGNTIKFEDIAYTDKLAKHELFALHYKRFLILLCGLDHRLKLFGDFYAGPQSMEFVSMAFQEDHFHFLYDDADNLLPNRQKETFSAWRDNKNNYLVSGSRVLCKWFELMNPITAPGACRDWHDGRNNFDRMYDPDEPMSVAIAYKDGNDICVDIDVKGHTRDYKEREFSCKVNLSKLSSSGYDYSEFPYLCLDSVSPEELNWYIHNRGSRANHMDYIRFFKAALKIINHDLALERDTRQGLYDALQVGGIAEGEPAREIIQKTVMAWRAKNRGKALPEYHVIKNTKAWVQLLDQMYLISTPKVDDVALIEKMFEGTDYKPLRLVISGSAKTMVYVAPKFEECDNRLERHTFVHQIIVERKINNYKEKSRKWAHLLKNAANETVLHEWDAADEWIFDKPIFESYSKKQALFAALDDFNNQLSLFLNPMDITTFDDQFDGWLRTKKQIDNHKRFVKNPMLSIPFGVTYDRFSKQFNYICISVDNPHSLLYKLATNDTDKKRLLDTFIRVYANRESAQRKLLAEPVFSVSQTPASMIKRRLGGTFFVEKTHGINNEVMHDESIDCMLFNWLSKNKKHWLSEHVFENGKTYFDRTLCLSSAGEEKLYIVEYENKTSGWEERQAVKYWTFFDIVSDDQSIDDSIGPFVKQSVLAVSGIDLARKTIEVKTRGFFNDKRMVVLSSELPDQLQPDKQLERWYDVPVKK